MITVDDHIAIPDVNRTTKAKYPYDTVTVGQSFYIPFDPAIHKSMVSLRSTLAKGSDRCKAQGKRFTLRTVENGVRVWRTE